MYASPEGQRCLEPILAFVVQPPLPAGEQEDPSLGSDTNNACTAQELVGLPMYFSVYTPNHSDSRCGPILVADFQEGGQSLKKTNPCLSQLIPLCFERSNSQFHRVLSS